jgi:predicted Zn-dependent protease
MNTNRCWQIISDHLAGRNMEWFSMRALERSDQIVGVRNAIAEPPAISFDQGLMLQVKRRQGWAYAATCDLSPSGLKALVDAADRLATFSEKRHILPDSVFFEPAIDKRSTLAEESWQNISLTDRFEQLKTIDQQLGANERVIDRKASVWSFAIKQTVRCSVGSDLVQQTDFIVPMMYVTATNNNDAETRSLGGHSYARQGGAEILESIDYRGSAHDLREQAIELLFAPQCPSEQMDVLLASDQMVLQIHESIGHPIELDRILGDERNYAGTSFVTLDMFGKYRYGSELLNISFDPNVVGQVASYGHDDDGTPAQKVMLIENGVLQKPLGGAISQARVGVSGVANSRAQSWNRPPIDRMANLNLEVGDSSLNDMVSQIERGVYLKTNCSWSIDDSRDKFQFGCEWGQLIEKGVLTQVVRKPNYRGRSANFWRNLKAVGDNSTREILGTPYCGKGEPNQVVHVGHATPACLFEDISVFGGIK